MAVVLQRRSLFAMGLAGLLVLAAAQAEEVGGFVLESSRAAKLKHCVEPTEYMRRNHMELIRHQRDTTVYGGIRSTKHSMAGCVNCHVGYDAERQPLPVNGDQQFCESCHDYAAIKLNCFDCHPTVPEGESWNHVIAAAEARTVRDATSRAAGASPPPGSPLAERDGGEKIK